MRTTITICLIVALSFLAHAQRAELRGSIMTADSSTQLSGFDVVLFTGNQSANFTTTDAKGHFEIANIHPGKYQLKIISFDNVVYTTEITLSAGETLTLFELGIEKSSATTTLDPTTIIKPRGSEPTTKIDLGKGDPFGSERDAITKTLVNVKQRNGSLEVGLGRPGGTVSFIGNGIGLIGPSPRTFAGLSGVEIIDRGVPARYGNFTGGGVRYEVKEIGVVPENFYQIQSTSPFNGFHHNLGVVYFSRPILKRKKQLRDTVIDATLFGISFQGNYKFQADPNPSAVNPFVIDPIMLQHLRQNPLVSSELIGGYVPSATFLEENDLVRTSSRPNAQRHDFGGRIKLSYAPNEKLNVSFINSIDYTKRRLSQANFVPMNSEENPLQEYRFLNSQLKLSHSIIEPYNNRGKPIRDTNFISRLSYTIDVNYQHSNSEISNFRHRDNFFNYGHVGSFETIRVPIYTYVDDGQTKFIDENGNERTLTDYHEFTGYRDSLIGFTPGEANPNLGKYTSFFYDKLGESKSIQELVSRGGLMNGQNIPLIYSLDIFP